MYSSQVKLFVLLALWGAVAALAGAYNFLGHLPPRLAPVVIAALSISFSVALSRVGWLRDAMTGLGLRTIIGVNVIRFVGAYFLWLQAQGKLPAEFAQRAGWGDIAAAVGAIVLLVWPEGSSFRWALFGWNAFAMLDLFVAVGTAGWLNVVRPGSMNLISHFPLALVPLWIVPVLLAGHVYLFRQLFRGAGLPARGSIHA
jgi:hypothetical protein